MYLSRRLAAMGLAYWADVTDMVAGAWMTFAQFRDKYAAAGDADEAAYDRLKTELGLKGGARAWLGGKRCDHGISRWRTDPRTLRSQARAVYQTYEDACEAYRSTESEATDADAEESWRLRRRAREAKEAALGGVWEPIVK